MPSLYPKKWFVVPHDEYPADKLPLGQLVGGIEDISHSLNRKTRLAPPPSDVTETVQTSYHQSLFHNQNLQAHVSADVSLAPVGANLGGGSGMDRNNTISADLVLTQLLRPSDEYVSRCFAAARPEAEMARHLRQRRPWNRKVFMVTGRKVGRAIAVQRDDSRSWNQDVGASVDLGVGVQVGAGLATDWKKGLQITSLTAEPCVFAVQLKRVKYGGDSDEVSTKDYVKGAVFERDNDEQEASSDDEENATVGDEVYVANGITEEEPRVDRYDYDSVLVLGPDGREEEQFLVPIGED